MNMEHGGNLTLVALSILIAMFGSFTALNLSGRIASADRTARRWWIAAAATALGGGIWAMHFVGMLAVGLPAAYDVALTLFSLALPIIVSGIGLHVVGRFPGRWPALASSGLFVGLGIAAMHYTGMAALELPGLATSYDPRLVVASIVIAILAATAALWLAFNARSNFQRLSASALMGGAISGMHYTGMAAASFTVDNRLVPILHQTIPKAIIALGVVGVASFLLLLALLTAFFDRKLASLTVREAEALQNSEERHRLLIENASDIIGVLDQDGRFVYESSSAWHVLGFTSEEMIGQKLTSFAADDSAAEVQRFLGNALKRPGGSATTELMLLHRSGRQVAFEVVATNLLHVESIAGIIVNLRDVTARTQLLAQVEAMSETDLLTGTLNRRGFTRLAELSFERARQAGEKLTVVMMDLDHFKAINDRFGHAAGDLVLSTIASTCAKQVRPGDVFGRVGGEEFAIVLAGGDAGAGHSIVTSLQAEVAACVVDTIRGSVSVTASFGVFCADPALIALWDALNCADGALYEAKSCGRDRIMIKS